MPLANRNVRKQPDLIIRGRNVMAGLCVLIMFAIVVIVSLSWPRLGTMFDRLYKTMTITGPFDKKIIIYAFYLLPPLGLFSVIGLILNSMRTKRKHDRWSMSLILGAVVAVAGGLVYFLMFM
jgi:uncharacterized BrkB/YihY/UPF0761 family membrane protein